MAKAKRFSPDASILEMISSTKPATPVMTGPEKTYYKGLKRRGFSEQQISEFIKKAGYQVPADFFKVWTKEEKAAAKLEREKLKSAKAAASKVVQK